MNANNEEEEGGNPSLDGWFYQCDVSVWAALALVVVKRVATSVTLEPASQEDLETELETPRVASSAALGSQRLVVQAKLRRSGHWTPTLLKKLVEHGKKRASALERLKDPTVLYVLATSADVAASLRSLVVEDYMEFPTASELPTAVFPKSQCTSAAGRFAILSVQTEARVKERIDMLLMNPLCVPLGKQGACRDELRRDAMTRMRTGKVWSRDEIEGVIRKHEGVIPSDPREEFVPPATWKEILRQVDERHAIVLTGPSGTGKSTIAKELAHHYKGVVPATQVRIGDSLSDIAGFSSTDPVIYYLDDPWGKYEVAKQPGASAKELKSLLSRASKREIVIVTTRSDIFGEAVGDASKHLRPWEVQVQATSYPRNQRRRLYENRLPTLPTGILRTIALEARERVLGELTTPFEINLFFENLKQGPARTDQNDAEFVARVVRQTLTESVEDEVFLLVRNRSSARFAAVLWALLKAESKVSRADLPVLRRYLKELDLAFRDGLEELPNLLLAAGWLKQPGSHVTYAHPRVEGGLVQAMKAAPGEAEDALSTLLVALARTPNGSLLQGAGTAARIVAALKKATMPLSVDVVQEAQTAIDAWLESSLRAEESPTFGRLLSLAATVGSEQCVSAEVARWLRPSANGWRYGIRPWTLQKRTDDWYARVRAHPDTALICGKFVRNVLTTETRAYSQKLAAHLDLLAVGLDDVWREAGVELFNWDYQGNLEAVAFGAMRPSQHREDLLNTALDAVRPQALSSKPSDTDWSDRDGHHDGDYGDYQPDDWDPNAGANELIKAYVQCTRADAGWQALQRHPQLLEMLPMWLDVLQYSPPEDAVDGELLAVYGVAAGTRHEAVFWRMLRESWRPGFTKQLRDRLHERHADPSVREQAAACALVNCPHALTEIVAELCAAGNHFRAIELLHDAIEGCKRIPQKSAFQTLSNLIESLPQPIAEIAIRLRADKIEESAALSEEALKVVAPLVKKYQGPLGSMVMWMVAISGGGMGATLRQKLFEAADPAEAVVLLKAAIALGEWNVVEDSLRHARADVREVAFEALFARNGNAFNEPLLRLATDKGSRVRSVVLRRLEECPLPPVEPLVVLAGNTWSEFLTPDTEDQCYNHARRAVHLLADRTDLLPEHLSELKRVASQTHDSSLRADLATLLAKVGGPSCRRWMAAEVFRRKPRLDRGVHAAWALVASADMGDAALLDRATPEWFETAPSSLAVTAAIAVGSCATETQVLSVADGFAASVGRRVLLIPLAMGAADRETLGQRVLERLPPEHRARRILDAGTEKLPHDLLDDLGQTRIVHRVVGLCQDQIEKRPRATDRAEA